MTLHLQPEVLETSAEIPSSGHSSSSQLWVKLLTYGEENMFAVPLISCIDTAATPGLF